MKKRCYHCREKFVLKDKQFVMKYRTLIGHHSSKGFVYSKEYWHPWCWELEKKKAFYFEGKGWSNTDPAEDKLKVIQKAKELYLKK